MTKHLKDQALWLGATCVVLALFVASGMGAAPAVEASPSEQDGTTVAITPGSLALQCGETEVVDIRINNVTDLYGVDVRVTYNPAVVEVVDANPAAPGVQVAAGDLPDASGGNGLVQVNSVDVDTGTISYAAVRLNPAPPQSGSGAVARVTFRGRAAGTSPVTLVAVVLSDQTARPISALLVNGRITVTCDEGTAVPPTRPPDGRTPTTAAPTATPIVPRPTARPGDCVHTVRPGETLFSIARAYGVTIEAIMRANGISNPDRIFAGQRLTIPGCQATPGKPGPHPQPKPSSPPPGPVCHHTVKPGETLYGIARLYGTTVLALQTANGISNPNIILAGQRLVIPGCAPGPGPGPQPVPPPGQCTTHVVRPGETLSGIAMMAGDCVSGLAYRNGIVNPDLIYVGQRLTVCPGCSVGPGPWPYPKPPACRATHVVKPSETLIRIALIHGTSVTAIQAANNIANPNLIYVGQQLCIP